MIIILKFLKILRQCSLFLCLYLFNGISGAQSLLQDAFKVKPHGYNDKKETQIHSKELFHRNKHTSGSCTPSENIEFTMDRAVLLVHQIQTIKNKIRIETGREILFFQRSKISAIDRATVPFPVCFCCSSFNRDTFILFRDELGTNTFTSFTDTVISRTDSKLLAGY